MDFPLTCHLVKPSFPTRTYSVASLSSFVPVLPYQILISSQSSSHILKLEIKFTVSGGSETATLYNLWTTRTISINCCKTLLELKSCRQYKFLIFFLVPVTESCLYPRTGLSSHGSQHLRLRSGLWKSGLRKVRIPTTPLPSTPTLKEVVCHGRLDTEEST